MGKWFKRIISLCRIARKHYTIRKAWNTPSMTRGYQPYAHLISIKNHRLKIEWEIGLKGIEGAMANEI